MIDEVEVEVEVFDFSAPQKKKQNLKENTILSKVNELMCWDAYPEETHEDVFIRNGNKLNDLPSSEIIDIVYIGGIHKWAESLTVGSQEYLYESVVTAMRKCISEPVFYDKKKIDSFPVLSNFFYYCQRLDRSGKIASEAESIADISWNGVICRRNLAENVAKIFKEKPDKQKYLDAVSKIRKIWGFTEKEVDAIRYYVCQVRHEKHNPSMNKCIYLWSKSKQTGKTTIARAIVTILNGDKFDYYGKYESTLSTEMSYNEHDLPLSALYNAVLLDEAMPKDTKKSYGAIKRVLTSSSCNYNPKFRQVINIKCKRFYFFTSNDDIIDFVQDDSERRFFAINIEAKPEQLSFDDIYSLWLQFCTNATPEGDWQKWYDSFDFVDGLATKDCNEIKNEILLNSDTLFGIGAGTYTTVKKVASGLFKNEPTREQKKSVGEAMAELFSSCRLESNKAYYSISMCRQKATLIAGVGGEIEAPF